MLTKDEINQIKEVVKEENNASEERVKEFVKEFVGTEIKSSEERVKKYVNEQIEDAVEVLTEIIHTGYNMLEERVDKIEDELNIRHPKKN